MNDTQAQIDKLKIDLQNLISEFYKTNFSASQDFNKYSTFTTSLKVPHYGTNPATCQVGEIIEVAGKLKICSATDTWTIVGTQS